MRARALLLVAALCGCSARVAAIAPASPASRAPSSESGPPAATRVVTAEDRFVDSLLALMTLDEKLGQLNQLTASDFAANQPGLAALIRRGGVGSLMEVIGADTTRALQRIAVDGSRLHIPLLFADDVIHGFRTVFPIPLAEASSWDPSLAERSARIAATEAAANGIDWTFAPMVDVARDPRWGRIMEGAGEDPVLGAAFAAARVRGFQGSDLRSPSSVAATSKHFAAYGAAEGGRDYDGANISGRTLREVYLPPFHAAVCAGVQTLMAGFNEVGGIPSHANRHLLTDILRGEWGFGGVVVSDWNGVGELIAHGVAENESAAGALALRAGVDVDMVSGIYAHRLAPLVRSGRVSRADVNQAVRRVLRLKYRLGLFDDPYHGASAERARAVTLTAGDREAARQAARESIVLLQNRGGVLPLRRDIGTVAVLGELAADSAAPIGAWAERAHASDAITMLEGIRSGVSSRTRVLYAYGASPASEDTTRIADAVRVARQAKVAIVVVGESRDMSGEASSRSSLDLPGAQLRLVQAVEATGVPTVVLLMNGRPLAIPWIHDHVPAVLETWYGGVEAGNAAADVLFGAYNPAGKLPVTFPRSVGQVPIYAAHRNTGRPASEDNRYTSRYIDLPVTPLYPFGHGLSYTTFSVGAPSLGAAVLKPGESLDVAVNVSNTGSVEGSEVVQLYLRDDVASVSRPVMELRRFQRVPLAPGETRTVHFTLDEQDLAVYDTSMTRVAEPGTFTVMIGDDAAHTSAARFTFETPDGRPRRVPERCARGGDPPERSLQERYPIVPWPAHIAPDTGEFVIDGATRVVLSDTADASLRTLADLVLAPLRASSGYALPVTQRAVSHASAGMANTIAILLDSTSRGAPRDTERYTLHVSTRRVLLSASSHAGIVEGVQTLRQLLPGAIETRLRTTPATTKAHIPPRDAARDITRWSIPAVSIEDQPRFRYRGILLDVARYYFPPAFLKDLVDLLSLYKFNVLQLHLTDDQGWRLEIRKYPRLTEVGAWRKETVLGKHFDPYVGDGKPHGGFYTQQQVRDLVAYAAARNVTIIPEIEMPGHAGAALAAYPELACTSGPFEVSTVWGVHEDIFCPSERTFAFLEDVLTEVMELFPSRYIHIGGDEVPKTRWKASPVAQALMKREGLKDEDELQSYFTRRIEAFLRAHGRKLIGWDEILQGGVASKAVPSPAAQDDTASCRPERSEGPAFAAYDPTVMSWRGMQGGIDAARQGHDVVMSPVEYAYLDHYQGDTLTEPLAIGDYLPLDTVYAFEPVPPELTPEQATHVLGAQGNLWTEYISTPRYAEYMLLPRMLALADVVWSPKSSRDWQGFLARLPAQFARLDALGANYRVLTPKGLEGLHWVTETHTRVALSSPLAGGVVRYTLDGSDPVSTSSIYTQPVDVDVSRGPVTVSARLELPNGRTSPVTRATVERAPWHAATRVRANSLRAGLTYAYRSGTFASADDVPKGAPERTGSMPTVALRGDEPAENYGVHLSGYVHVPADALYTFHLTSDDGARLRVDGELVVDFDGQHGAWDTPGQIALRAGWHAIDLTFFQASGDAVLKLELAAPNLPKQVVPPNWLAHTQ